MQACGGILKLAVLLFFHSNVIGNISAEGDFQIFWEIFQNSCFIEYQWTVTFKSYVFLVSRAF